MPGLPFCPPVAQVPNSPSSPLFPRAVFYCCIQEPIQEESRVTLTDFIFGKPLATSQERAEQIGPAAGIPIFGLDALSSAGYGPEAALTILLPLGVLGVHYIVPISPSIVLLLAIVYFSYLQTIKAYPAGS